jgi:hypothetical protein
MATVAKKARSVRFGGAERTDEILRRMKEVMANSFPDGLVADGFFSDLQTTAPTPSARM